MRIDTQSHSINTVASKKLTEPQDIKIEMLNELRNTNIADKQDFPREKLQEAVDTVNELFEINNRELKFVFHEGLEQYFVQLVNSETEEVVREIPPKKLLDVFYEMQKLAGMIVDEKI